MTLLSHAVLIFLLECSKGIKVRIRFKYISKELLKNLKKDTRRVNKKNQEEINQ